MGKFRVTPPSGAVAGATRAVGRFGDDDFQADFRKGDGTANMILKNTASGNTTNYDIAADNRYGQIVDLTATGVSPAVTGSSATGTLSVTTHPWANFSH